MISPKDQYEMATANLTDIPDIVKLVNSAYRGEDSKKGWTTEAYIIEGNARINDESIKEIIENPEADIIVLKNSNSKIEGSVYLHKKDDQLYLGMLSVEPGLQNKGIGKQLLQAAERYATEKNCKSIFMTVISVRTELIEWYERHGYVNTGEKSPFPSDDRFGKATMPLEFIKLEKQLNIQPSSTSTC